MNSPDIHVIHFNSSEHQQMELFLYTIFLNRVTDLHINTVSYKTHNMSEDRQGVNGNSE